MAIIRQGHKPAFQILMLSMTMTKTLAKAKTKAVKVNLNDVNLYYRILYLIKGSSPSVRRIRETRDCYK